MRINNNMLAMNTHRQMGITGGNQAKAMEKLSSGQRINRAGDDAAGLAISEKMRGQIRGLNMASKNSQDGISMIQTAEGALNETHEILQRMRELATQSANDTNVGADRTEIQKEMNQLTTEINRIGNTTEFNTQAVLKGDGTGNLDKTGLVTKANLANGDTTHVNAEQALTFTTAAAAGDTFTMSLNGEEVTITFAATAANGKAAEEVYDVTGNSATVNLAGTANLKTSSDAIAAALEKIISANDKLAGNYTAVADGTSKATVTAGGDFKGSAGSIGVASKTGTAVVTGAADSIGTTTHVKASTEIDLSSVTDAKDLIGKGITINDQKIEFYNANDGAYTGENIGVNISDVLAGAGDESEELVATIVAQLGSKLEGVTLSQGTSASDLKVEATKGGKSGNDISVSDGGVQENFKSNFQVGANQGQSMTIEIKDMRANALGLTGKVGDEGFTSANSVTNGTNNTAVEAALDVSTHEKAAAAITSINDAIEKVSAQRSDLGSFQNRLEHTIKNLDTSAENLQAAEARVRDVDMAKEMMNLTKQNILQQASQAMMAQANQQPQGVLQLLR